MPYIKTKNKIDVKMNSENFVAVFIPDKLRVRNRAVHFTKNQAGIPIASPPWFVSPRTSSPTGASVSLVPASNLNHTTPFKQAFLPMKFFSLLYQESSL